MKTEPLKLVFMGSDVIALPLLNALRAQADRVCIQTVYTQPDRPVGRGQKVVANGIKQWAIAQGIPVRQPEKLTAVVREELAAESPDVALVMAYGHILREKFINTPRLGTLNLHASLLPRYRGASPIQSAVVSGDDQTGVALMRIVRELDAGPVADVETVAIGDRDTALDVEHKLAEACVPLVLRNLDALTSADGPLAFIEQDHAQASFCRRLTKADGVVDFRRPAREVARRINGLFPWPGCRCELNGQTIKLGLAEPTDDLKGAPGEVLQAEPDALIVAAGEGAVRLLQLQRPGARMMPAGDFLRGFTVEPGTLIPSVDAPAIVSSQH